MRLAVSPISFIFQFTPLCERLRLYHFPCGSLQIISIHASLREATVVSLYLVSVVSISIHASLREATDRSYTFQPGTGYFNSRLSARGYCHTHSSFNSYFYFNSRLSARGYCGSDLCFQVFFISIHASLREATPVGSILACPSRFQFTPLCERLLTSLATFRSLYLFQFTPLCERLQQKQTIYSCISA